MAIQFFKRYLIQRSILLLGIIIAFSCDDRIPLDFHKAYITLQGQDRIAVVDMNAGDVMHYVDVDFTNTGDMPHYIVIDETHHYWYCTLIANGSILKFDLKTDELVDSVFVGNMPALMELDEQREFLYVSRFMPMMGMSTASQLVHKIDAQTMTIVGTVNVGADSPHGIALSSDGNILWVASNQASHFFKIDTDRFGDSTYQPQNFRIGSDVPSSYEINDGFYNALELELNQNDTKLFISCSNSNEIRVFDTTTGDSLDSFPVGMMPWHFQLSKDDAQLFVANRMGNSISIINIFTGEISNFDNLSMDMLHGCALSGNDDLLVVTSPGSGNAYVYDTENELLLHEINLGNDSATDPMPTGVAIVQ
jgi:DNA-binding beta-propeller fold protein YncE